MEGGIRLNYGLCYRRVMIQIAAGTKVYLGCRPVVMRRGFDGLSAEVVNTLNEGGDTRKCRAAARWL